MKKIVKLTESDLARIVKRVLKESSSDVVKIKAFEKAGYEVSGSGKVRALNLNLTNVHLENTKVVFDYSLAGGTTDVVYSNQMNNYGCMVKVSKGTGSYRCGEKHMIFLKNVKHVECESIPGGEGYNGGYDVFFITPKGKSSLMKWCDAYVSNDIEISGDYA